MNVRVRSIQRGCCTLLSLVLILMIGCTRDPNVKKKRYLDSGKRYAEQHKYREAAIQFQNAIQVDTRYADARYELAQAYMHMGSWQAGYAELSRVIEIQPNNLRAHLDLGGLLLAAHQLKQAAEQVDLVLNKDPNNAEAHMLQGGIHAADGDYLDALQEAQLGIRLDPKRAASYYALALIQRRSGQDLTAVEASLKQAIAVDPKMTDAMLLLADVYEQQGRAEDAKQLILQAVSAAPAEVPPRTALVRFHLRQNQQAQAEDSMRQAAKDLPDTSEIYRLLGDFYWSRGENEKALAEYQRLLKEHPKDRAVRAGLVQLLIANNRLDEAAKLNDEILSKNGSDVDALIAQSRLLLLKGKSSDAAGAATRALKSEPDNADAHFLAGNAYDAAGDPRRAEGEYREAARLKPDMFQAQLALALIAYHTRDVELLTESSAALVRLQPKSPVPYIFRAASDFAKQKPAAGEADLRTAMELGPDNPVPYARMAQYRVLQKKYKEAETLFEQSLQKKPDFDEGIKGLVTLFATVEKNPAKAIVRVNQQIASVPQSSNLYVVLAKLQAANNQTAAAEASYQKAIQLDKNNLEAMLLLAELQTKLGHADKAIASYQQAAQANPRDTRPHLMLGTIFMNAKDYAKAEQEYRKVLELDPDSPVASNDLAYTLLEQDKDIDLAVSLAQVGHQKLPDLPSTADTLAWAYYHKGAYGLAIDLLERAAKQYPEEADFHYHLGMAYDKNGNSAMAKAHLEKALQLDPQNAARNAEIRKTLAQLKQG